MKKKSSYRVIAEAMALGKLGTLPTNSVKYRKLQREELSHIVKEEFEEAKSLCDLKIKEGHFASAALESGMNWDKTLNLSKAFKK